MARRTSAVSDPWTGWQCEDCEWRWPLKTGPPVDAECDNCGGKLRLFPIARAETGDDE